MRKFAFEVVTSSSLSVDAEDGRQALDVVEAALRGATAQVVTGPGTGLKLGALRMLGDARLTLIDGVDPFAKLEEALRALRDGPGRDQG